MAELPNNAGFSVFLSRYRKALPMEKAVGGAPLNRTGRAGGFIKKGQ